jgi:hypothetical protein
MIRSWKDIENLTSELGFLPFFSNEIKGFSIEENTPPDFWFAGDTEGPWEWKGPVIRELTCAYGKLFQNKAGYVSLDWYPELVNYRRSKFKMTRDEKLVYNAIADHGSLLTHEIRELCGYVKPRAQRVNPVEAAVNKQYKRLIPKPKSTREGYETVMTRLQMHTFLVIADFEYQYTVQGKRYTWGWARFCTPEALYGADRILACSNHSPEQSRQLVLKHLKSVLPHATDAQLIKIIG